MKEDLYEDESDETLGRGGAAFGLELSSSMDHMFATVAAR
jgi:hypothetical protein